MNLTKVDSALGKYLKEREGGLMADLSFRKSSLSAG